MEIETGSQTHISQECGHTHTERLRCRSADVFWISVLLLLLGEELLGESVFAYVCAAAAIRFTEGGKSGIREQPAGCASARMVAARSGHARRMEANRWSCSSEWPRDTRGDVYRCSREQRGSHVIAPDREYWRSSSLPSKRFGLYRPPSGAACLDHLPLADRSLDRSLYSPHIERWPSTLLVHNKRAIPLPYMEDAGRPETQRSYTNTHTAASVAVALSC